jgi:hypothetical protein
MDKLESLEELFAGRHFDREVIIPCDIAINMIFSSSR